ncbi:MAG: hypothetical protein Ct9H300mP16_09160 [Pseudomonadota bacterium]|nr:MAG: hypothetical protein Ct9H300mP16_09160 [Pseudomonadota bacterium]
MMFSSARKLKPGRWIDRDSPTRQPLSDIVVGISFKFQGDALGKPRAEALASGTIKTHMDGAIGQPLLTPFSNQLVTQYGPYRSVGIGDRQLDVHRFPFLKSRSTQFK